MVTEADILEVLKTIPDPEMPISIVDLGIVHRVRITSPDGVPKPAAADRRRAGLLPGASADGIAVVVDILPTFVGCPALAVIQQQIVKKLSTLAGVSAVEVNFVYDPPWSVERISPAGREALAAVGITTPGMPAPARVTLNTQELNSITCPYCGSSQTQLESAFGPTRCKMIYYCDACGSSFEHMKTVK
jgi:ring-1,2-phenylacetyl-CoA epoxidase subunit PaaD